jgi:3-keto-disaccharide hydrolase
MLGGNGQRRTFLTGLGVTAAATLVCPYTSLAQSSSWTTLFDGKNLDHWTKIGTANWRLEDGIAVADKGNGFLVSKDSYGDFELKAEFWVDDDANSGIFFRCSDPNSVTGKTRLRSQCLGPAA